MNRWLLACIAVLALAPASGAAAAPVTPPSVQSTAPAPKIVAVDYVIALLEANVSQDEIAGRIASRGIRFRLAAGDVDRLRAAGAGDDLIDVVLENSVPSTSMAPQATPPSDVTGTETWGRPQRLGGEEPAPPSEAAPPAGEGVTGLDAQGEGITEEPYSSGGSSYGWTNSYGFIYYGYPYPYYYYPSYYYYPYYYPRYYYYPHPGHGTPPSGSYRTQPRGTPHSGAAPRGGAPGGGHAGRPAPRGSHH